MYKHEILSLSLLTGFVLACDPDPATACISLPGCCSFLDPLPAKINEVSHGVALN